MNFNCKIESEMGAKTRTADSTFIVGEKPLCFKKSYQERSRNATAMPAPRTEEVLILPLYSGDSLNIYLH